MDKEPQTQRNRDIEEVVPLFRDNPGSRVNDCSWHPALRNPYRGLMRILASFIVGHKTVQVGPVFLL